MGRIQGDKQPVLELEALRNAISADRDEAFFNVGYEHGLADALARARRGSIRLPNEVKQFATETRERMVQLEGNMSWGAFDRPRESLFNRPRALLMWNAWSRPCDSHCLCDLPPKTERTYGQVNMEVPYLAS